MNDKKLRQQSLHRLLTTTLSSSVNGRSDKRHRKLSSNRVVGVTAKAGVNYPEFLNQTLLEPSIKLHPEAIAFLFFTGGCSKNLLLYILLERHDCHTGLYKFNASVRDDFQKFCMKHFEEDYTESTIIQAHRNLVTSNITLNVKTGTYFLNPLLSGGSNTAGRRSLINEYSKLLSAKGKDAVYGIYPLYEKTTGKKQAQSLPKKIDVR